MKNLLPALLLGLAPLPAAAQAVFPASPPPEIRGPYVGATFGVANNRNGCNDNIAGGGRTCDSTDHSFSAFAGYQVDRNFSGELSVRDLGKVTSSGGGTTLSVRALAADLSAIGRVEMIERLFAHGRFGVYGARLDRTAREPIRPRTGALPTAPACNGISSRAGARASTGSATALSATTPCTAAASTTY